MMKKKGNSSIMAVSVFLSITLIMCVIFEYMQMFIICTGIKDAVQSAVVSSVVANYDDAYSQLREGYSGGYTYVDNAVTETIDTGNIYTRLDELLALKDEGEKHTKYAEEEIEYSVSNLKLEFSNTAFAQGNANKNLDGTAYIDVEIPVRFSGKELTPIRFTLKVKAGYTPKF